MLTQRKEWIYMISAFLVLGTCRASADRTDVAIFISPPPNPAAVWTNAAGYYTSQSGLNEPGTWGSKGTFVWNDGHTFSGIFDRYGEPLNGKWTFSNGDRFQGTSSGGNFVPLPPNNALIYGTYTWVNGVTYKGPFTDSEPSSSGGVWLNASGSQISPEQQCTTSTDSKDTMANAYVELKLLDNSVFKGTVTAWFALINGSQVWPDGSSFVGDYDYPNDGGPIRGTWHYANGTSFTGTRNDSTDTLLDGTFTQKNGEVFTGSLTNGQEVNGEWHLIDGDTFKGSIDPSTGKWSQGTYTWATHRSFSGTFDKNGQPTTNGTWSGPATVTFDFTQQQTGDCQTLFGAVLSLTKTSTGYTLRYTATMQTIRSLTGDIWHVAWVFEDSNGNALIATPQINLPPNDHMRPGNTYPFDFKMGLPLQGNDDHVINSIKNLVSHNSC